MSLADDMAAEMPFLREQAESRMRDSCVIFSSSSSEDPDPATGKHAIVTVTVYEGPCEYKAADVAVRETTSAGREVVEQSALLKIPVGAPGSAAVAAGMRATVTLTAQDSAVIEVRIKGGHRQSYATARRLPVEEVGSG